jgi:hypothetical protein
MKKLIPLLLTMVVTLLAWNSFVSAQTQDTAKEEKPTFYRLIPGVYVNGWPRFTITYPKDWVERRVLYPGFFGAAPPGSPIFGEGFGVMCASIPQFVPSLDKYVDFMVPYFKRFSIDATLMTDKQSRLRDGTPARELEFKLVVNGEPRNCLLVAAVATKKGDLLISANVNTHKGTIGEDLRAIPYSIELDLGKDDPVKLPPDIQEFLDRHCNDLISHDLAKFMTHYSDRYLSSGVRKGEIERMWRQIIGLVTSAEVCITEFVAAGDRVHLAGFGVTNLGKGPLYDTSIIKESGQWKWYGNQRDVIPVGSPPK